MANSPTSSRLRLLLLAGLFAAFTLALSGCMRLNMAVELHENNLASMQLDMAFQDEAIRAMGYEPAEFWADAESEIGSGLPLGAHVEAYPEPGWTGSRISIPNSSIADLSGFEEAGLGDINITREGDIYNFRALSGLADEMADLTGEIPQGAADLSLTLTLTCPGMVDSSNGAIGGEGENRVTWDLTEFSANDELWARCSAVPTGGHRIVNAAAGTSWLSRWWPLLLASVLTLGLLGALAYFLRRSSHHERDTVASNFGDTANWSHTYHDPDADSPNVHSTSAQPPRETETYLAPHEIGNFEVSRDWNDNAQD